MGRVVSTDAPVGQWDSTGTLTTATTRKSTTVAKGTKSIIANCSGDWSIRHAPPVIACFKTVNDEVDFTDYTSAATDRSTSTSVVLNSLDTAANGDYWYVACRYPFGGIWVDVDSANGNASDMTGYYWAGSWTNITITDGSASGGACLAVDGAIVWTVPTNWQAMYLSDLFPKGTITTLPNTAQTERLYIVRFQVSAAVDSSTTLDEVATLADTAISLNGGLIQADTDYTFNIDRNKTGCIEYFDAVGSKNLILNFIKENAEDNPVDQ